MRQIVGHAPIVKSLGVMIVMTTMQIVNAWGQIQSQKREE
jgi:hypothetical protein